MMRHEVEEDEGFVISYDVSSPGLCPAAPESWSCEDGHLPSSGGRGGRPFLGDGGVSFSGGEEA